MDTKSSKKPEKTSEKKTEMKISESSFRTSLNGFNKNDVIKYISEANRRFAEKKEKLEAKANEAEARADASAAELRETRVYFLSVIEKMDGEIETLKGELEEMLKNTSEYASENKRLRLMLDECKEQLDDYNETLEAIESSHKENVTAVEKERERAYALRTENEHLKEKYAALEAEHNVVLAQMRKLKKSSAMSDEISSLIAELREKYEYLEERLSAQKRISGTPAKKTYDTDDDDVDDL